MPSTSPRAARGRGRPGAPPHGRPRPPVGRRFASAVPVRPLEAPFAFAFGLLVAAEDIYLGWLLWEPDGGPVGVVVVPVLLAVLAVAGATMVLLGRARGWVVLTVGSVLPLVGLLALVLLFGALGGGAALWQALLLLVGPIGCLALTLRRPVREWTAAGRARRPGRGRRDGARMP